MKSTKNRHQSLAAAVAVLLLGGGGCVVELEPGDELGQATQAAAVRQNATLWPNEVHVCFRDADPCDYYCSDNKTTCDSDADCDGIGSEDCPDDKPTTCDNGVSCATDADCTGIGGEKCSSKTCGQNYNMRCHSTAVCRDFSYSTAKTTVMGMLNENWAAYSALMFVNDGDCGSNTEGKLEIKLQNHEQGGNCGGASCRFGGNPPHQRTVLHEVGHALGMPHEHSRPDVPSCADVKPIIDGCTACLDGSCSLSNLTGCTCSASDYNDCFDESVTGTQTLTADLYNTADQRLGDHAQSSSVIPLTAYDPMSVMSYCSGDIGENSEGRLTPYDQLGIELLYPKPEPISMRCVSACWETGNGYIVTDKGLLEDEWTHRRAMSWWTSLPKWRVSGSLVHTGSALPAAAISGSSVTFSATSKWTAGVIDGEGTVTKSNRKWASVMSTLL